MMDNSEKLESLINLIYNGNLAAADSCRDLVSKELLPDLLLTYRYLKDWDAKERCIHLVQDYHDQGTKSVMLDFLQAPCVKGDDERELSKAIAIGFMGSKYERFMAYYYDRNLLYADIDEVLMEHQLKPFHPPVIGKEEKKVIQHDFNYNEDKTPSQNLMNAAWTNDIPLMKEAIKRGAHLDAYIGDGNKRGCTCLIITIMFQHFEATKFLIQEGANIHSIRPNPRKEGSRHGQTAMWWAANHGQLDIVQLLIDKGASVNVPDWHGSTPLHQAASKGHIEVVKSLLDAEADIHKELYDGRKAIHLATEKGHRDVVTTLLNAGNDVNETSNSGYQLIHTAIQKGHATLAKLLVSRGADVNAIHQGNGIYKGIKGWTPLIFAVDRGLVRLSTFLLDAGADPFYEIPVPRRDPRDGDTLKVEDFIRGKRSESLLKLIQKYKSK